MKSEKRFWDCRVDQYFSRRPVGTAVQAKRVRFVIEAEGDEQAWNFAAVAARRGAKVPGGLMLIGVQVISLATIDLPFEIAP